MILRINHFFKTILTLLLILLHNININLPSNKSPSWNPKHCSWVVTGNTVCSLQMKQGISET